MLNSGTNSMLEGAKGSSCSMSSMTTALKPLAALVRDISNSRPFCVATMTWVSGGYVVGAEGEGGEALIEVVAGLELLELQVELVEAAALAVEEPLVLGAPDGPPERLALEQHLHLGAAHQRVVAGHLPLGDLQHLAPAEEANRAGRRPTLAPPTAPSTAHPPPTSAAAAGSAPLSAGSSSSTSISAALATGCAHYRLLHRLRQHVRLPLHSAYYYRLQVEHVHEPLDVAE